MKQLFKLLVGCMLMMAWPLVITSCEGAFDDIFGEWSRPTGQQNNEPTKEEVLDNLSSALEEGAVITITYTLDGVKYTSTLKKQGDEFIELSPAAAATRAMTRSLAHPVCSGMVVKAKNILNFKFYNNEQLKLDVSIETETCELVTNYASSGSEIVGVGVNGQQANLKKTNNYFSIDICRKEGNAFTTIATIDVKELDTWWGLYNRLIDAGDTHMRTLNDVLYYSVGGFKGIITNYNTNKKVLPSDQIYKSNVYYLKELVSVTCKERSWDETNYKVVTSDKTFDNCKIVSSSDGYTKWEAGNYVIIKDIIVTIDGILSCDGDVNLILCDDCTLKVNGSLCGNGSLTIYGQAGGTGKLSLSSSSFNGIYDIPDLVIHGGNIETSSVGYNDLSNLKMYGGKFSAKVNSSDPVIKTRVGKNMTIYGGELEAFNCSGGAVIYANAIVVGSDTNPGSLTVYGGKVTASAPNGQAIIGKFARGEGVTDIVFSESDNGTDWTEITAGTSSKKYFKTEEGVPAYVPTDEEISALYAKLGEDMDITADMVSEWIITTLVGDIVSTAEAVTETYAKPLAEKICTEKSLTSVVLYMGGKDASGYDFYAISGSSKGVVHLASDAAIPAAWSGLKIFYVAKPKE